MPAHGLVQSERGEERSDKKQKGPGCEQCGFDEFPVEHGLARHGAGQEKGSLTIEKKIGGADDEVAQKQHCEQKGKQEIKQPLGQDRTKPRESGDKAKPFQKQPERESQVTKQERNDGAHKEARLL